MLKVKVEPVEPAFYGKVSLQSNPLTIAGYQVYCQDKVVTEGDDERPTDNDTKSSNVLVEAEGCMEEVISENNVEINKDEEGKEEEVEEGQALKVGEEMTAYVENDVMVDNNLVEEHVVEDGLVMVTQPHDSPDMIHVPYMSTSHNDEVLVIEEGEDLMVGNMHSIGPDMILEENQSYVIPAHHTVMVQEGGHQVEYDMSHVHILDNQDCYLNEQIIHEEVVPHHPVTTHITPPTTSDKRKTPKNRKSIKKGKSPDTPVKKKKGVKHKSEDECEQSPETNPKPRKRQKSGILEKTVCETAEKTVSFIQSRHPTISLLLSVQGTQLLGPAPNPHLQVIDVQHEEVPTAPVQTTAQCPAMSDHQVVSGELTPTMSPPPAVHTLTLSASSIPPSVVIVDSPDSHLLEEKEPSDSSHNSPNNHSNQTPAPSHAAQCPADNEDVLEEGGNSQLGNYAADPVVDETQLSTVSENDGMKVNPTTDPVIMCEEVEEVEAAEPQVTSSDVVSQLEREESDMVDIEQDAEAEDTAVIDEEQAVHVIEQEVDIHEDEMEQVEEEDEDEAQVESPGEECYTQHQMVSPIQDKYHAVRTSLQNKLLTKSKGPETLADRYMKEWKPTGRFQCKLCFYSCVTHNFLFRHWVLNHCSLRPYMCGHCGFQSATRDGVTRHQTAKHRGLTRRIFIDNEQQELLWNKFDEMFQGSGFVTESERQAQAPVTLNKSRESAVLAGGGTVVLQTVTDTSPTQGTILKVPQRVALKHKLPEAATKPTDSKTVVNEVKQHNHLSQALESSVQLRTAPGHYREGGETRAVLSPHTNTVLIASLQATSNHVIEASPTQVLHSTPTQVLHSTPTQVLHSTPTQVPPTQVPPTQVLHTTPTQVLHTDPTQALQTPHTVLQSTPTQVLHSTPTQVLHSTPTQVLHPAPTHIISNPHTVSEHPAVESVRATRPELLTKPAMYTLLRVPSTTPDNAEPTTQPSSKTVRELGKVTTVQQPATTVVQSSPTTAVTIVKSLPPTTAAPTSPGAQITPTTAGIKSSPTTAAPTTAEAAPTTAVDAPTTAVDAPTTAVDAPTTAEAAPTTAEVAPTTAEAAPTTAEVQNSLTTAAPTSSQQSLPSQPTEGDSVDESVEDKVQTEGEHSSNNNMYSIVQTKIDESFQHIKKRLISSLQGRDGESSGGVEREGEGAPATTDPGSNTSS